MIIIALMRLASVYLAVAWCWNTYFRLWLRRHGRTPPEWTAWVRFELDYLVPVALLFVIATDWEVHIVGRVLNILLVGCWWVARRWDRDDDRWKRRLERGAGLVRRLYNRLVVVPAGR